MSWISPICCARIKVVRSSLTPWTNTDDKALEHLLLFSSLFSLLSGKTSHLFENNPGVFSLKKLHLNLWPTTGLQFWVWPLSIKIFELPNLCYPISANLAALIVLRHFLGFYKKVVRCLQFVYRVLIKTSRALCLLIYMYMYCILENLLRTCRRKSRSYLKTEKSDENNPINVVR